MLAPVAHHLQAAQQQGNLTRLRHVDIFDIIASVAAERLGWAWPASSWVHIVYGGNSSTTRARKGPLHWPDDDAILQWLATVNKSSGGRSPIPLAKIPTYDLPVSQLLSEDRVSVASPDLPTPTQG